MCCNGCIIKSTDYGSILQLQGDHRTACAQFLSNEQIVNLKDIAVHGA